MIFVTTGTQEPFDRLLRAIDEIAPMLPGQELIVQASLKSYTPENFKTVSYLKPADFDQYMEDADLVVSHAGMGTIITALERKKPLLVMPRLLKYGEHRNEHQLATAQKINSLNFIHVAFDENELREILLSTREKKLEILHHLGKFASDELINSLRSYVNSR